MSKLRSECMREDAVLQYRSYIGNCRNLVKFRYVRAVHDLAFSAGLEFE